MCTGCGVCAAVCPGGAISMHASASYGLYVPEIDKGKCSGCGLCLDVCPGHSPPGEAFRDREPLTTLTGHHLAVWSGYAMDEALRYRASSGGLVTATLLHMMDCGEIDGALVTLPGDGPFCWEGRIARDRMSIMNAMGSKYYPSHIAKGLKEVLDVDGRYAFVGLPCQVQGLRKAQQRVPVLRSRVPVVLALFCNHVPTFDSAKYLMWRAGVARNMVASVTYRGDGWPGGVRITTLDERTVFLPHAEIWSGLLGLLFIHHRCLLCNDHGGRFADASFGDAWLPQYCDDRLGRSVALARTSSGEDLLSRLVPTVARLDSVPAATVESIGLRRHRGLASRAMLARLLRRSVPEYGGETGQVTAGGLRDALLLEAARQLSAMPAVWPVLEKLTRLRTRR